VLEAAHVLSMQGYMRCGQKLCDASASAVRRARRNELEEWMVKTIEDRFELLSAVLSNTGQWMEVYGFPKLAKAGGAPPVNYPGLHMEMGSREGKAKRYIGQCITNLGKGTLREAAADMISAHGWICCYTSLMWQACRIEVEDVTFQFRRHFVSLLQYEKLIADMHDETRSPQTAVQIKGQGMAFSCMLETMSSYKMMQKLSQSTGESFVGILLLLAALWLRFVHKRYFIDPLLAVEKGSQRNASLPRFSLNTIL